MKEPSYIQMLVFDYRKQSFTVHQEWKKHSNPCAQQFVLFVSFIQTISVWMRGPSYIQMLAFDYRKQSFAVRRAWKKHSYPGTQQLVLLVSFTQTLSIWMKETSYIQTLPLKTKYKYWQNKLFLKIHYFVLNKHYIGTIW